MKHNKIEESVSLFVEAWYMHVSIKQYGLKGYLNTAELSSTKLEFLYGLLVRWNCPLRLCLDSPIWVGGFIRNKTNSSKLKIELCSVCWNKMYQDVRMLFYYSKWKKITENKLVKIEVSETSMVSIEAFNHNTKGAGSDVLFKGKSVKSRVSTIISW